MPKSALWVCFRSLTIEIENAIADGSMWVAEAFVQAKDDRDIVTHWRDDLEPGDRPILRRLKRCGTQCDKPQ